MTCWSGCGGGSKPRPPWWGCCRWGGAGGRASLGRGGADCSQARATTTRWMGEPTLSTPLRSTPCYSLLSSVFLAGLLPPGAGPARRRGGRGRIRRVRRGCRGSSRHGDGGSSRGAAAQAGGGLELLAFPGAASKLNRINAVPPSSSSSQLGPAAPAPAVVPSPQEREEDEQRCHRHSAGRAGAAPLVGLARVAEAEVCIVGEQAGGCIPPSRGHAPRSCARTCTCRLGQADVRVLDASWYMPAQKASRRLAACVTAHTPALTRCKRNYVQACTRTHARTHACAHARSSMCTRTRTCTLTHACVHAQARAHAHVHTHTHSHAQRDGLAEFRAKRIPGASFFPIDDVADPSTSLPHMLPSEESFAGGLSTASLFSRLCLMALHWAARPRPTLLSDGPNTPLPNTAA